jgi:hypothetical protein
MQQIPFPPVIFYKVSSPSSKPLHFLSATGCHIAITLQETGTGKHKGRDVLLHHGVL